MSIRRWKRCALRRKCDKCTLRFFSHFCLFLHLQNHGKVYSGWFRCFQCKKRFKTIVDAVKHRQRHLSIKAKLLQDLGVCSQLNQSIKEEKISDDDVTSDGIESDIKVPDKAMISTTNNEKEAKEKIQENSEMFALKFIEQLKAALDLDKEFQSSDIGSKQELLQISEISSSENHENLDSFDPATSDSAKEVSKDGQSACSKEQGIISTTSVSTEREFLDSTNGITTSENLDFAESKIESVEGDIMVNDESSNSDGAVQKLCIDNYLDYVEDISSDEGEPLVTEPIKPCKESELDGEVAVDGHKDFGTEKGSFKILHEESPNLEHQTACLDKKYIDKKFHEAPAPKLVNEDVCMRFSSLSQSLPVGTQEAKSYPLDVNAQRAVSQTVESHSDICYENESNLHKIVTGLTGKSQAKEDLSDYIVPRKYACSSCKAKFVSFSRLRRHKRIVHNKHIAISSNFRLQGLGYDALNNEEFSLINENRIQGNHETGKSEVKGTPDVVSEAKDDNEENSLSNLNKQKKDLTSALNGINKSLFKCKLCEATFLTAYGEKHHILRRHNENKSISDTEISYVEVESSKTAKTNAMTQTQALELIGEKAQYLSQSKSVMCDLCGSAMHCQKQKNIHMLEKHGLEVTYENEAFTFVAAQPVKNSRPNVFTDNSTNAVINAKPLVNDDKRCTVCFKHFSRWYSMKKHMLRQHNIAVRRTHPIEMNANSLNTMGQEIGSDKTAVEEISISKEQLATTHNDAPNRDSTKEKMNKKRVEQRPATVVFTACNSKNESVTWKANFLKKKFKCFSCDFEFSGFFILRRHMKEKHEIFLDSNGHQIRKSNPENSVESNIEFASNREDQDESMKNLSTDNSSIPFSRITQDVNDIDDIKDRNYVLNIEKRNFLLLARTKNGNYECPHCASEFKTLIDRYIHIIDNHGKGALSLTSDKAINEKKNSEATNTNSQRTPTNNSDQLPISNDKITLQPSKPYSCSLCESSFDQLKALKCHTPKAHGVLYQDSKSERTKVAEGKRADEIKDTTIQTESPTKKDKLHIKPGLSVVTATQPRGVSPNNHGHINLGNQPLKTHLLFTCKICSRTFSSWKAKSQHMMTTHNVKLLANTARKSVTAIKKIKLQETQVDSNSASKESTAGLSSEEGKTSSTISHGSIIIDDPPQKKLKLSADNSDDSLFECDICMFTYRSKKSLNRHVQNKHDRTFKNTVVQWSTSDNSLKKDLKRPHVDVSSKIADILPAMKVNKNDMEIVRDANSHSLKETATSNRTFIKTINTKQNRNTNSGEGNNTSNISDIEIKIYSCSNCDRKFLTSESLEEHNRLCSAEHIPKQTSEFQSPMPYPYTNKSSDDLENSYSCDICNVVFKNRDQLKTHVDQGICKLTCPIPGCGEEFASRLSYENHTQNTCTLCHSKLLNEKNLKRHYRDVHKIKSLLSCDLCMEKFAEPISLAMHNREKHMTQFSFSGINR